MSNFQKVITLKYLILFTILNIAFIKSYGQNPSGGNPHNHKNEISVAAGVVPLLAENEITGGLHLHYTRAYGKWGIGLAAETIFDEHRHYTFSVVAQYRIYKGWTLSYAPGLLIRKEGEGLYDQQFASHIETTYEFQIGDWHIGPVAEIGIEQVGVHYMGGIHLGYGF